MKTLDITKNKTVIILQGGSASGKTSIAKYLESIGIPKVITCTTRNPKPNEKDKVDYYFFDSKTELLTNELYESAEYAGNLYGTTVSEINSKLDNSDVICIIMEKMGAKKFKEDFPNNVIIVSCPIDLKTMRENMECRADDINLINGRLQNAVVLGEDNTWDYADYTLTGNDLDVKRNQMFEILCDRKLL